MYGVRANGGGWLKGQLMREQYAKTIVCDPLVLYGGQVQIHRQTQSQIQLQIQTQVQVHTGVESAWVVQRQDSNTGTTQIQVQHKFRYNTSAGTTQKQSQIKCSLSVLWALSADR